MWKDSGVVKKEKGMLLKSRGDDFSYRLKMGYGKGAFWHCDGGKLYMGREEEKQTTLYYSFPNMPTRGILELNGKEIKVKGTTWFDKQGEPSILWIFAPTGSGFPCGSTMERKSCCFIFPRKNMQMGRT